MNVFLWHVHGSYTTALVHGGHRYLLPVLPDRGPDGRGRAQTWVWPQNAEEVTPQEARDADVDVVILQRPEELHGLSEQWLGRRPGRDLPAVYLEHNAPVGPVTDMVHPAAGRMDITLVHVTHFNRLFWDDGGTPVRVIEHGVVDPGYRYVGKVPRAAVVVNDPLLRGRVTGTDIVRALGSEVGIDVFGMRSESLGGTALAQGELHEAMAMRRVYLHPVRWTSLGLSLIEAMHIGMPIVALATTEVAEAVPHEAGLVSNRIDRLTEGLRRLIADPGEATVMGRAARCAALERFGLSRFLGDWNDLFEEVTA
ncbi:MAG TPA: glycosyltransferase [Mycobacterium sp.]|nr:glycosyltransferase [Mycobacterium sp.]